ncbi:MerR family DNA-binding transcriptional regulator [Fictibacillus aquaticus]|uniref:MerR family transcriptional regulator n=1 Tax=Fictibacillus aquaticus TaxID=2021314 RepID=A0A235FE96_9BACL|nr:MerR family DNA-binding transcriptional regulator [Fictibacillus aquaticus]OYD59519.1 MerR family transcriptional regulator [Fictibacillus aquaticus]
MFMISISQLSEDFDVTTRTIRYYEEIGLLSPERTDGNRRMYSNKDIARLKLIVRGKKYGFNLDEIKEMIVLFDKDRSGKAQMKKTITYGKKKLEEVNERIEELQQMKTEMEVLLWEFENRLRNE